jgi:hypothetical protein
MIVISCDVGLYWQHVKVQIKINGEKNGYIILNLSLSTYILQSEMHNHLLNFRVHTDDYIRVPILAIVDYVHLNI